MSSDAFAEFERAGCERAAPRYEEYWTDTVLFVEPLLGAAGVRAGSRVLDVACGPGFVSEAAAARGARPVGVDIATAMVERARMRCPDLTFVVGDALRLPPERLEAIRAAIADAVRGYADGEEFALPIAARLISARASRPTGDGQADRERQ
jgi:ubiquinone/menaquinone biosynthesis C-methylase UbiE